MVLLYWCDASVFVEFSLTGTVDCILVLYPFTDTDIIFLVFRTSVAFIESCHLSSKFNGFIDIETNGLVSLRDRILGKVAINVECLFRRGTTVFVVMVVLRPQLEELLRSRLLLRLFA